MKVIPVLMTSGLSTFMMEVVTQDGKVIFPRVIINGKDWFRVELVIGDYVGELPKPTARIADISDIREGRSLNRPILARNSYSLLGSVDILT